MTSAISLAEIYYKADGLNDYICDYGADDWDVQEELMGDEWWKGFDDTKTKHFHSSIPPFVIHI